MATNESDQSSSEAPNISQMSEMAAKELAGKLVERWGNEIFPMEWVTSPLCQYLELNRDGPRIRLSHHLDLASWLLTQSASAPAEETLLHLFVNKSATYEQSTLGQALAEKLSSADKTDQAEKSRPRGETNSGNALNAKFAELEKQLANSLSTKKNDEAEVELEELKSLVLVALEKKLGSPEDHLNSIREQLRKVSSDANL